MIFSLKNDIKSSPTISAQLSAQLNFEQVFNYNPLAPVLTLISFQIDFHGDNTKFHLDKKPLSVQWRTKLRT